MSEIVLPLGPNGTAEGINDQNVICGWMGSSPTPGFTANAFIWHDGKTIDLGIPPGATATTANAINNRGDACGFAIWPDPVNKFFVRRACAWIDGQFIDLGIVTGYAQSIALDINDAREIVGTCFGGPGSSTSPGFIWRNGGMTPLIASVPPGSLAHIVTAHAINNKGQITGEGIVGLPPHSSAVAFLLTPALPAIPGNTDCNNAVDVDDLIAVILGWNPQGPVGGDPADVNRDNRIDYWDLIEVILHWGPGAH